MVSKKKIINLIDKKKISNQYTNTMYIKFLGCLTKNGKKAISKRILDTIFYNLSTYLKKQIDILFHQIFIRLYCFVEIKKIRKRKNFHIVPFSIKKSRSIFLVIKWLILSVNEDKRKVSIINKYYMEILQLLKNKKNSKSFKKKNFNIKQAFINRSNIHFRW